ncbi:COP23 domain-containing protein [Waterburya agarophytonicola K14]|uniref:COP23 domain-containing protein n=1 Tax=Waterburya agarophytonicola KI4 TaxID=2874699 RepID=A0A964BXX8_9CYAN|nr:COP23 domain-containing protein [Waterburya agarophytonicola]MCC0179255.1 COP23 domain-containing protein [Waterburya agarophytonicola KI4]
MKLLKFSPIAVVLITSGALLTNATDSKAQSSNTYFCGASEDGTPTTFAQTLTGTQMPIIRWEKEWSDEYTPQSRCELVSENFQQAYENGELSYLVVGEKNSQSTICASRIHRQVQLDDNQECKNYLFTLRNADDPNEVVSQLEKIGSTASTALIQSEGNSATFKSNGVTWYSVQINPDIASPTIFD